MSFSIYRLCLIFIHFLYRIIEFVHFKWFMFRRKIECLCTYTDTESDVKLISNHVKSLSKLPCHIAFILGNEPASSKDLLKILLWCITSGISYITFYDYTGLLKKDDLVKYLNRSRTSTSQLQRIIWGNEKINGFSQNSHRKNGTADLPDIHVNVLSLKDCKKSLVTVTSHLCNLVSVKELNPNDIDQKLIDQVSRLYLDIPDPELAVICGRTCCTYGFLPWHIRVTEFLQIQSHHDITVTEFVSLLNKYAKVEQRFGK